MLPATIWSLGLRSGCEYIDDSTIEEQGSSNWEIHTLLASPSKYRIMHTFLGPGTRLLFILWEDIIANNIQWWTTILLCSVGWWDLLLGRSSHLSSLTLKSSASSESPSSVKIGAAEIPVRSSVFQGSSSPLQLSSPSSQSAEFCWRVKVDAAAGWSVALPVAAPLGWFLFLFLFCCDDEGPGLACGDAPWLLCLCFVWESCCSKTSGVLVFSHFSLDSSAFTLRFVLGDCLSSWSAVLLDRDWDWVHFCSLGDSCLCLLFLIFLIVPSSFLLFLSFFFFFLFVFHPLYPPHCKKEKVQKT